ncbi:MAG: DUF5687 family protein [Owenweeksia sp.]|nr:DUF5687 family protein [Owenweeksia sp.]
MYATLLRHQWKKTFRSKAFTQGWGIKLLMGFLILYFGLSFLALGFLLPEILAEVHPEAERITPLYAQYVLYYLLADLAMRFFLQDLNLLNVQHYLLKPIRKSKIVHFLLGSSVFNFFNLLPLLFIVPFAVRTVGSELGWAGAIFWLASMLALVLCDHFGAIYVKRAAAVKQWIFIAFAAAVGLLFLADSLDWLSLNQVSAALFTALGSWWFMVVVLLIAGLLYQFNYRFLLRHSYIDQWKKHSKEAATQNFSFLESKGTIGTMMAAELKLILRNKRTKGILVMAGIFCLYGLLFYGMGDALDGAYDGMGWQVFAGIFMTGIFMINYGQFLIGWEGAYFDGILTRAYPMESFFRAKFWLLVLSSVVTYLITLGYIYFTLDALWINTACFIYNIGVNSFVLLFASTYQKKKIDLSKGSAFNYQGTSATQFLVALPLMILPILIFQAFNIFDRPYYGLVALAAAGLLSLAFSKYWFKEVIKNFKEKKYRNAAGFREG